MDHRRGIAPPPTTMAAVDRLSGLPDDLLRRILYFAPAREGASTAALSRRWPGLWATSGAVNLDTRSYDRAHGLGLSFEKHASFVAGAAAAAPVRRLAVDVVAENLYCRAYDSAHVLADPAARHVEELRLRAAESDCGMGAYAHGITFRLSFAALTFANLRRLHITNCTDLAPPPPPPAAAFPLLAELVLLGCTTPLVGLHGMIDAAPQLAVLHLELTLLTVTGASQFVGEADDDGAVRILTGLSSPTMTSLVLANCVWPEYSQGSDVVELDMPMLWRFKYHGRLVHRFSLKPKPPNMTRAHLHFIDDEDYCYAYEQMREPHKAFWRFVQNFDNAKFLKLELDHPLDHIAAVTEKSRRELLAGKLFSNLEHLELQGRYTPAATKIAAAAIANLLHCCPVVRDLRIRLRKSATERSQSYIKSFIERRTRLEFDKSVDHFRRRRRMVSLGGDPDDENYEVVSDIPGLSGQSFDCLQRYLRRVSLRFPMEDRNCFGVQLTKFFAESALVLEEMYVGDGNHKMCEHMNRRVETWIANSSKRRGSASKEGLFAVLLLPLEN